jgi:hypothetical protein
MSKKPKIDTNEINSKLKKLESVKRKLKSEFIGIDHQIEQLVESVKVWYIFPQTLNKPLIVNLWGITGTFKTSVIRRFCALLDMNNQFKEIDARKIPTSTIRSILGTGNRVDDPTISYPSIFLLDEFQNIRTISNKGDDTDTSNELYELFSWLSDGKIKYTRSAYDFSRLNTLVEKIKKNRSGLIADIHKVAERRNSFKNSNKSMDSLLSSPESLDEVVARSVADHSDLCAAFYDSNYSILEEYYVFTYDKLVKFKNDLDSMFDYIIEQTKYISLDYTLDLSKCLIFIAGNVDEAFAGLTHNMDNEILTPDQFYEISSQVNFNVIKESLLYRFKPEQVARLGTNHVIFPSFNTKMYTKFIEKLHKRTIDNFSDFGIKIEIDDSITQFILTHAAIPSQGSRSVLSAHEYLVDSNIPEALAKSLMTKGKKFTLAVDVFDNILIITNKEIIVKEITIIDKNVLENYDDHDLNHTISLHEAGHAIVGIAVMGILPDVIKTRLNNGEIGGYCKFAPEEGIMTRNEAIGRIALSMGGYAAETIRKGFDNVSIGSSSDILSATNLASVLVKVLGLGSSISASGFSMGRDSLVTYNKEELEKEVEELVEEGLMLAFTSLVTYDKEHKELTKILMNQPTTRAKDIKHLF